MYIHTHRRNNFNDKFVIKCNQFRVSDDSEAHDVESNES